MSLEEKLSKEKLKELFLKIDKRSQDSQTIQILESRIFPEKFAQIDGIVPEFELPKRDNSKFNLSSLDGKYYLIDFWASWCAPCRKEIPNLKKVYATYKSKNFEIVNVSIDKDLKKWENALDKENMNWINVIDTSEWKGEIASKYALKAIPSNFLVDTNGKIIAKNVSITDLEILLKRRKPNN